MKFSWQKFCVEHRISYITSGPHSAKGNIHIKCPWCGSADRSEHMGLSLNEREPFFACWRNPAHRGRNPARLIAALLDCTWQEAIEILERDDTTSLDQYEAAVARWLTPTIEQQTPQTRQLYMPEEFLPLYKPGPRREKYLEYLAGRGFDEVERMAAYYDLHYCRFGSFAERIILPVYFDGMLVSWVGRAVGKAERRYINLSEDPETAKKQGFSTPAVFGLGSLIFNYDRAAQGGRTLVINEGPFDALKIDWFCDKQDTATAVFGMPKGNQLALLVRTARKFKRVRVALDRAAFSSTMRLYEELEPVLGKLVGWLDLPPDVKDPGALPGRDVAAFINS